MTRIITSILLSFILTWTFAQKEVPFLSGRVVDEAGILDDQTLSEIEGLLKNHEDSTSNQIAVLIIPSLEGEVLEEYSLEVAETWALGQKGKDNGVLILVALNDRKMRIEVGYGLEGDLTDALSSRIIRNEIAPSFRQENYGKGIKDGVNAVIAAINGSYQPGESEFTEGDDALMADVPWYFRLLIGGVFLLVIGTFTFLAFMTKGCASWFLFLFLMPFYATFPVFIFGVVPAGVLILCYFFGFLYFKLFYIKKGKGKEWFDATSKKWEASRSSSFSGGGWSSSSSSSFSGGGGSFGGGGSSGSW